MARSIRKGPFVDDHLAKKVDKMNKNMIKKQVIKTWARRSTVLPDFVGHTFAVHNGKKFVPVFVTVTVYGTSKLVGPACDDAPAATEIDTADSIGLGVVGERSDTMVILHVGTGGNHMVSLPRDLWVTLDSGGQNKLNAARLWGKEWHFRIGVHLLRGLVETEEAAKQYADLADATLRALSPVVHDEFARKHGDAPGRGAVVLGIAQRSGDELVKAVVTGADDLTRESVIAYCQKNLATFKLPRTIEIRDEMPRNAVGKILAKYLM